MNRAAEETIASEDIQERTLISREAQATKDVTGERTGAFAAPVRSQLSAAQAVAGVFQVAKKVGGVKQRRGLIFGVNFSRMPRGTGKAGVTPGICTAFCSFVSWFWREAGTSKSPVELEQAYRDIKRILASAQSEKPCCNWQIWRTELGGISRHPSSLGSIWVRGSPGSIAFEDGGQKGGAARKMKIERIHIKD